MKITRGAGIAFVAVLAALGAIDYGAWYWTTGRMVTGWDQWRAEAAAQGMEVQSAPPVRTGWPLAADLLLGAVTVDGGIAGWRADIVRLNVSPLHPATLGIVVEGEQSLRLNGLPPIAVTARGMGASVPLMDPEGMTFEGHSITAHLGAGVVEIGVLAGRIDPGGVAVALSRLTVPAAGLPFGGMIDRAAAHFRLTVSLVQAGAGAPQEPAAAAAAWARAGGQLIVDDVALVWGALDVQGRLTAGLDAALQPAGSGALHMTGYHDAIEALVRAGTISRNAARVVTTVLDMMATSTNPAIVDVPLSLKDGSLAMGAIPLLRIPPITWP